jgi:hypothetical protein
MGAEHCANKDRRSRQQNLNLLDIYLSQTSSFLSLYIIHKDYFLNNLNQYSWFKLIKLGHQKVTQINKFIIPKTFNIITIFQVDSKKERFRTDRIQVTKGRV